MERGPAAAAGQVVRRLGLMGLPIGFRFQPTDEELVLHYLRRKAFSCPLPADIIPVVDLAKLDPWDLPGEAEGERYFFYLAEGKRGSKQGGSRLCSSGGFWKAAGKEKAVVTSRCKRLVGVKRTLAFYPRGGARSTEWVMHEYRLAGLDGICPRKTAPGRMGCMAPVARDWVVCRVFKKSLRGRRHGGRGLPMVHHNRSAPTRGTAQRRGDPEMMPSSPTTSSSCVTEASDDGEESCSAAPSAA